MSDAVIEGGKQGEIVGGGCGRRDGNRKETQESRSAFPLISSNLRWHYTKLLSFFLMASII